MKRISKFIVAILVLGLLFSLMTVTAFAPLNVSSEEDIQDVIDDLDDGEEITIRGNGDIALKYGVEIDDPCTIHFENIKFTLDTSDNVYHICDGEAAFYVDSDDVTLDFSGCTFESIACNDDSVIYVDGSDCTVRGGTYNNCCNVGDGGVIYMDGNNGTVVGCTFNNCFTDATGDGGAVYLDGENCLVSGCTFNNCKACTDGGGIAVNHDNCTIENCTFTGCNTNDDGGAIYLCTGVDDTYIAKCTFTGCKLNRGLVGFDDSFGSIFSCNSTCSNVTFDGCTFNLNDGEDFDDAFDTVSSTTFKNCNQFNTGSVLSTGNIVIICVVAVVAVAAVIVAVVVSKKKKAVAKN